MKNLHKIVTLLSFIFCAAVFVPAQGGEREKGIELYERDEFRKSAESLQKAVETNEEDKESWLFLGMALARSGGEREARRAFAEGEKIKDADLSKSYDSPIKIISKRPPQYTAEARGTFTTGRVKLFVEFRKDGVIGHIFVAKGLANGLTQSALDAARQIRFEPAVRKGQKVTVIKKVEFTFDVL